MDRIESKLVSYHIEHSYSKLNLPKGAFFPLIHASDIDLHTYFFYNIEKFPAEFEEQRQLLNTHLSPIYIQFLQKQMNLV